MRELPVLMNGFGVRATLAGIKTQTRRPITRHAPEWVESLFPREPGHWRVQTDKYSYTSWILGSPEHQEAHARGFVRRYNPLGIPGDFLYVRETFRIVEDIASDIWLVEYRADGEQYKKCYRPPCHTRYIPPVLPDNSGKWRPSIHMPKWTARTWLRVTGVRVERVRDITAEDVIAEGMRQVEEVDVDLNWSKVYFESDVWRSTCPFEAYAYLWDSIYAKRGLGWSVNPFVWVTSYEVTER